jgi:hypothetical protein
MRTLGEMIDMVEGAQRSARKEMQCGTHTTILDACKRVATMRNLLGLGKWDGKSVTITEKEI